MINGLVELLIVFTLVTSILLLAHRYILANTGPVITYASWLIVPLTMLISQIEWPAFIPTVTAPINIARLVILPSETTTSFHWFSGLTIIWGSVGACIASYWLMSHIVFKKRLHLVPLNREALPLVTPNKLAAYQSSSVYSPMLVGVIKPRLVLPTNFFELYSKEQQVLILEHELCHFTRNDMYWNLLASFIVAACWFHPLSWLAFARFRRDQELSCDHTVLARKQKVCRVNYSKALLVTAASAPTLAFAQLSFKKYGDKHMMFERINQIKANKSSSKVALTSLLTGAAILLSAVSYAGNVDTKTEMRTPPKAKVSISPIHRVEPKYPIKAATENIEGSVVLKYDVDTGGNVINVEVMKGEPAYVFDRVAVTALKQWKYKKLEHVAKNNLVQLDFAMDHDSTHKFKNLTETILVTQ